MTKYTDRIDVNAIISLYEYGYLRNPETGKTLVCLNPSSEEHSKDSPPVIKSVVITQEDVMEALMEVEDGFWGFIGVSRDSEEINLDNGDLTFWIMSIDQWHGWFIDQLRY